MTMTDESTPRPGTPSPRPKVWPLAPLQEGLLYHASSGGDGLDVYSMQSTYAFAAGTDPEVLHRACSALLERHDALRAGFSTALMDRPVQFIPASVSTPWRMVDCSHLPAADATARLETEQVAERQKRFDMDVPPLIRFVAVDLGEQGMHLIVTNHHIIIDGWSDALLVVELLRHMAAGGRDTSLPPAPSFGGYIARLQKRDATEDSRVWRRALSGLESGSLIGDTTAGAQTTLPDVEEIELGEELTDQIAGLARRCAVSPNTVYSTVWGLALRDLTGCDDVVFGTTVSGRPADLAGVDEMFGLFLNTVPQRLTVRPAESVEDLLTRVQAEQAVLVEHHHVGLATIQQEAGVGELFDTLYVMRNTPTDDEAFEALSAEVGLRDIDGGDATHYPATFIVHPDVSTRLILSHRPDALSADAARAVLTGVVRLLRGMVAAPGAPVGTLSPRSPEEMESIVSSWAGDALPLASESLVDELARVAREHPDRMALVDRHRKVTFAELWSQVEAGAQLLRSAGVKPGDRVTVELPRGIEVVVAIFAAFAVRAAYVPIDLGAPASRQEVIRAAARPVHRITPESFGSLEPDHRGGCESAVGGYRHDDLAYVMFTSGSTGRPKGVAIEHTGLVNMLANHRRRIFTPAGGSAQNPWRVAHAISFAFDMSWEELLWLLDGHEVHLLDDDLRRDPGEMTDYIGAHGIDVINVTPSVAGALLADGLLEGDHVPRLVLLGGETVTADVWDALREAPGTQGYNLYGPTEYTINTLGGGTRESRTPIVGRPIDNTDIRVLDSGLNPVPDGVPGELYVTGAGLARGYHGAPMLTAERFVADPHGAPGSRMYRTGDVVSRRPDGVFDFHGRSDAQVKIRGHRVEPGEVQAVLASDPRVAQCAVTVTSTPGGGAALVAYVVPQGATGNQVKDSEGRPPQVELPEPDIRGMREHLRQRLPEVMVPSAFVGVEWIPLTVHSKLDVSALPSVDLRGTTGRGPRGPVETAVCEVFAEVLGMEAVGAEDNFFALGGHSLTAMRVVGLLGKRLGRRIGVAALMAAPTPASLVRGLDSTADAFGTVLPLGGRSVGDAPPVFCVHPMLGLGWTFSAVAARLADGRAGSPAVYALQSPALRDSGFEISDMTAYADLLVEAMADAEPRVAATGVHLVGWSFGAHVAHMMATRAAELGIGVRSLTLLDPGQPCVWRAGGGAESRGNAVAETEAQDAEQEVLAFLLAASLRDVPEWMTPPHDIDEVLGFLAEGNGTFSALGPDDVSAFARVGLLGRRMLDTAVPRPVETPTTLVQAGVGSSPAEREAVAAAWRKACSGPFRVESVDVSHHLMTSPFAAEAIADLIPQESPGTPTPGTPTPGTRRA